MDQNIQRAVTVGTFDGVHRGHKEVLRTLRERADALGLTPLVVTFDRHPLETVAPERAPRLLQERESRDALLRSEGVDVTEVAFTPGLCRLTAGEWIEVLRRDYGARLLISGYDNKFGSDGQRLAPADYVALGHAHGIEVVVAPELPGVCSSAIRAALGRGDVEKAGEMLGRRYRLEGRVESGRRLGRELGFPTANLRVDPRIMIPAPGVYAALSFIEDENEGESKVYKAVVNIGDNPTVGADNPLTIEAHLLHFDGDLYGKRLALDFISRIRGERKFDSLDSLRREIAKDAGRVEGMNPGV